MEGDAGANIINYDTDVPLLHSYLGELEDTRHTTPILDGDGIFSLPFIALSGAVLFPGATIPLRVTLPGEVAAVERALSRVDVPAPFTIAVVCPYNIPINGRPFPEIGTTALIRKYRRIEDGSLNVVACGQQRFKLRNCWSDMDQVPYAEIQVIEEDIDLRTPRHSVSAAFLPNWVYDSNDSNSVAQNAADLWKQRIGVPNLDSLVNNLSILSFYFAGKIPLSRSKRQNVLEMNGIVPRLKGGIKILTNLDRFRCQNCQVDIAWLVDIVSMSKEGPLGIYIDSDGDLVEIMTFLAANLEPGEECEFDGFPGYHCRNAICVECGNLVGWRFTTPDQTVNPTLFWGLLTEEVKEHIIGF